MKNTDYDLLEEKLKEHIKLDTYYPNCGAGGQHCGMDNGISITFKPLNLCIKVHEFRSQHKKQSRSIKNFN